MLYRYSYWSLPVLILVAGLSLPTHPSLDGVTATLYSVPHRSVSTSQPPSVPLQLCRCPAESAADAVYTTPATPSVQLTDTMLVLQSTVGRTEVRGQGADEKETS